MGEEPIHRDDLLEVHSANGGFRLVGEIDLSNADVLREILSSTETSGLTLDLSACTYIGSEGIAAIMEAWRRVQDPGRLVLLAPTDAVRRVLEVTGLDRLPRVTIADRREDPHG